MKQKNTDPTKVCVKCGSKSIVMIYKGLETDMYECKDCGKKYGVTDPKRW